MHALISKTVLEIVERFGDFRDGSKTWETVGSPFLKDSCLFQVEVYASEGILTCKVFAPNAGYFGGTWLTCTVSAEGFTFKAKDGNGKPAEISKTFGDDFADSEGVALEETLLALHKRIYG